MNKRFIKTIFLLTQLIKMCISKMYIYKDNLLLILLITLFFIKDKYYLLIIKIDV